MSQIEPNREWVLRYVLGELSEEETRQADERFFADDTLAGMLDETYRDLLDAYAAGEIEGAEKERVERAFFNEPHQAGRLRILRAMQFIPERALTTALPEARSIDGPKHWHLTFWPFAASACVLSVAIALVVIQRDGKPIVSESRNAPTNEAGRGGGPETGAQTPVLPPSSSVEKTFTILLLPDVTRGSEDAKTFAIPVSTNEIIFQAVLPANMADGKFQIRLKGAKQLEAKVFSGLEVRTIAAQKYVEFRMPEKELPADSYAVDVFTETVTSHPLEHFVVRIFHASLPEGWK
jgi:hypothetical protein